VVTVSETRVESALLYERARRVLPGGNTRTTVYRAPHPVYAASGHGCRVVDVDGIERTDFVNNYTALIHGHAHPRIVEAASQAIATGACFGLPTASEIALAETLCARGPTFERVRFTNSGTEAVLMALKAARAATGRPKVAKCEGTYHGTSDYADVSVDPKPDAWGDPDAPASLPSAAGAPASLAAEVVVIPYNRPEAAIRILDAHADELAAVLLDPLPNRIGFVPATPAFVDAIAGFCRRSGTLLVSDEVMSFRLGCGGAQPLFGYEADLTTLGKIIGGGFPVGAVAGRADVMAVFDPTGGRPKVPHGGTFNANPVTMAAGLASLELLSEQAIVELNALGETARVRVGEALREAGLPWQTSGMGSLFRILPTSAVPVDYRSTLPDAGAAALFSRFVAGLLDRGILIDAGGIHSLSTPMTSAEIELLADAVHETAQELSAA
jgi:glutamate-1-semialdehyde 2,1-aminomutase